MTAAELIGNRRQASATAFVDKRVKDAQQITQRRVMRGKVKYRNPSTGEYAVSTGGGETRFVKSVASSDLTGKDVIITVANKIGQIAEMPGFN